MGPVGRHPLTGELFQPLFIELINPEHPLVKLSALIDWTVFETRWLAFFPSTTGRPATSLRLVAGLRIILRALRLYFAFLLAQLLGHYSRDMPKTENLLPPLAI